MSDKNNKLRMQKYITPDGLEIVVNTNYRHDIGYRAIITGQPGKFGDSLTSPTEAIGNLLTTWIYGKVN